jgi:hypothetical protein
MGFGKQQKQRGTSLGTPQRLDGNPEFGVHLEELEALVALVGGFHLVD